MGGPRMHQEFCHHTSPNQFVLLPCYKGWRKILSIADISVTSIAAGEWSTCALTSDGALWCWGINSQGQLGIGSDDQQENVPMVVSFGTGRDAEK